MIAPKQIIHFLPPPLTKIKKERKNQQKRQEGSKHTKTSIFKPKNENKGGYPACLQRRCCLCCTPPELGLQSSARHASVKTGGPYENWASRSGRSPRERARAVFARWVPLNFPEIPELRRADKVPFLSPEVITAHLSLSLTCRGRGHACS